ncbi:MAG TPA: hypothetical protein VLB49_02820 [Gemmatimonadales bacterium]|nr:hypothetical protein [Gemmatimonadales bacterium]
MTAVSPAYGGGRTEWLRSYLGTYAAHASIPAWARKYNMNCSGCHYPAAPRLNATGIRFRWAGFRMPDEMGEKVDVTQLSNYISLRGRMRYEYSKSESQPVSTSAFTFNDATLFYAGPFGRNFSGFTELEREPSGEIGLVASIQGVWGKENSYRGFRAGQMHWLLRDGVAGFDRPTGVRTPNPVNSPVTAAIPFRFSADQLGVEGFLVSGRNRISVEVLNGIRTTGSGDPPDPDTDKDFAVTDQLLFDDAGSGLTAVGYYGTVKGLDPLASTLRSHFARFAISANKIVNRFEVLGGFVYGKDQDLPAGAADVSGLGYWVSGQYMFPKSSLTVFGRYEFVDPNTDLSDNGSTRVVGGLVLPVGLPEYLRLALEAALDFPQAAAALNRTGLTAELMLNF